MTDTEQLEDVLAARPEQTASRLICPRRLDPDTSYLACVVPAFEAGRRAGLGLPAAAADETSLRPAWSVAGDAPVKLPVYYSWRFATGAGGDFESLAEALRPRPIPPEVGRHELYVGAAGPPLPALPPEAPGAVVALRGALVPPEQPAPPWPPATRAQVQEGLRQVLDTAGAAARGGWRGPRRSGRDASAVRPLARRPGDGPENRRPALDADAEPRPPPSRSLRPSDSRRPGRAGAPDGAGMGAGR